MGRKRSATLTDGELRLMRVLWSRGASTVADVMDNLGARRSPAYNTVQTMMRILEAKGYVQHRKVGRAFVFEPLIDESQARRSALRYVLDRFFDNSPHTLVLSLLEDRQVDRKELAELQDLVGRREGR
ncbi:MAG: BlaI/MecI/CopY family transcriptional regulator [Acidobacteriota bacterium]